MMNRSRANAHYDGKIAGLYDLGDTLGRGHFAVVKLAKHVFTGEQVAVKVIDKTKLDDVSRAHLFQEVRCMKLVQHPNVVRLYDVIDTQTKLYLILELGDGGDMYDYILKHENGVDEETAKKYFRQIVHAISYCHKLHVVHRDLKPENVVFFEKLGMVKLTDFGFSNKFCPGQKLETSCGSLAYSAPEILLGDSYDAPKVETLDCHSTTVKEEDSRTKWEEEADNLVSFYEASEDVNTLNLETEKNRFDENSRHRINDDKAAFNFSSNGSSQRSSATDCYIFPKKVSDAETRSFVRARSDTRRNSTCTQMMMETFPFSSFTFVLLRPWIAAVLSVILKGYFFLSGNVPFFQTLLLPYVFLEIAFCSWTKFELQTNSRQVTSSFISGIFLLCGIPVHIVTIVNSVLHFAQSAIQDLAVYVFSFVFFHFICETYM